MLRDRIPLVLSATALVVAVFGSTPLGEAAYNAVAPNSVGAKQLRDGAVTNAKLRGDAVTSGKVLNGSLKAIDFKAGQLPAGAKGEKGEKGEKGDKGAKGEPGAQGVPGLSGYTVVEGSRRTTTSPVLSVSATCPAGSRPIGGGGGTQTPAAGVTVRNSFPTGNTWLVVVDAKSPSQGWNYVAFAICARVST